MDEIYITPLLSRLAAQLGVTRDDGSALDQAASAISAAVALLEYAGVPFHLKTLVPTGTATIDGHTGDGAVEVLATSGPIDPAWLALCDVDSFGTYPIADCLTFATLRSDELPQLMGLGIKSGALGGPAVDFRSTPSQVAQALRTVFGGYGHSDMVRASQLVPGGGTVSTGLIDAINGAGGLTE
jgi:hypothetical protein